MQIEDGCQPVISDFGFCEKRKIGENYVKKCVHLKFFRENFEQKTEYA